MSPASKHARELLRFADFELDVITGELRSAQTQLRLQPQPLRVLMVLLRRPGELVSREELKQELMPDAVYGDFDHAINIAVSKLRTALNDPPDHPRLIETIPRRGYRFLSRVEENAGESVARPARRGLRWILKGRRRWLVVTIAGCGAAALVLGVVFWVNKGVAHPERDNAVRSLAVLPLMNLSHDLEQEYFADGMTDALITELTQISSLRVVSRTSVMHYKGSTERVSQIARELNADAIVEGSVTRAGDRVRINAQLIDARTDSHLWARNYDRDLHDVLSLQSEVALAIAEAVRAEVMPEAKAHMGRNRAVEPAAYDLYLKGRYQAEKYTRADLRAGIEYLRRAIQTDPGFAPAYADLSIVYANSDDFFLAPKEAMPEAHEAAANALKLDDSLPAAHFAMACVDFTYSYQMNDAEREFKRAIELAPRDSRAHYYYGFFLVNTGRFEDGIAEGRRGLEPDPLSLEANAFLGMNLYFARKYDLAVEKFRAMLNMEPNYWLPHMFLGLAYERRGDIPTAQEELQKAHSLEPEVLWPLAELGYLYAHLGRKPDADEALQQLMDRSKRDYVPAYNLATVYAGMGNAQQALSLLEQGYQDRSAMMVWINVDPEFDELHANPRFVELVRKIGFSQGSSQIVAASANHEKPQ